MPYLGHEREANPFMGWRSIRLTSAYPEFFQTQLRAILRAGVHGKVSLLFPMISTLEEVQRHQAHGRSDRGSSAARRHCRSPRTSRSASCSRCRPRPCASTRCCDEVDFVSIGSNDLIQYLMAADRDNPKVAHLCEPFSPPILRLLAAHHPGLRPARASR